MTDTVRDIITEALIDLGVLAEDETPSAAQAAGALKKFNGMLELMGLDAQLVYGMDRHVLPLVSNQEFYTIGTGGNLNIPRPNEINHVAIIDNSVPLAQQAEYPVFMYNDQEWAEEVVKGMTAQWPAYGIYFDWQYPFIKAYTNPIANSSQYSMIIYTKGMFAQMTIDQTLACPQGYRSYIVSELAITLSGSYSVEVPASVMRENEKAQALISVKNLQINELKTYGYGSGFYNIKTNRTQ
jgi:hypothetical protein